VFADFLVRLAAALDRRALPYMIIGGQAVLNYGRVRLTEDIDVLAALPPESAAPVLEAAEELNLSCPVPDPLRFARENTVLPFAAPGGIKVQFIFSAAPFDREAIARAVSVSLPGGSVRIAALNDLLIYKVIAGRPQDLDDVEALLRCHSAQVDTTFIHTWLRQPDSETGLRLDESFSTLLNRLYA
jgi:hypothetical protein